MMINKDILLEFYLNKYLLPSYNAFKRFEVTEITHNEQNRINVKISIIFEYEKLKSEFLLTGILEEMFIIENTIPSEYLKSPVFNESKNINFERLKKEIKHYIKIIIYKRINLFDLNIKIEKTPANHHKQST